MPKHGKNFRAAAEKVEKFKLYSPLEAVKLVKEVAPANIFAKGDQVVQLAVHQQMGHGDPRLQKIECNKI